MKFIEDSQRTYAEANATEKLDESENSVVDAGLLMEDVDVDDVATDDVDNEVLLLVVDTLDLFPFCFTFPLFSLPSCLIKLNCLLKIIFRFSRINFTLPICIATAEAFRTPEMISPFPQPL